MKLVKQNADNRYAVANLTFTDLKTIKDACKAFAAQGSKAAAKVAEELESEMDNVEI